MFSVSCKSMNSIPLTHLYVVDTTNRICSKRIITDKQTLASRFVEDMPLENCDGYIATEPEEFGKTRVWLKGGK